MARLVRSLSTCLVVVFLAGSVPAWAVDGVATDAPSEKREARFAGEVTVTATGEAADPADLPVPVTVVDREEIEDSGADTVADLLRQVPGVTVMRSGAEGTVTSVFTRGTGSNHTLVLFDGVRLNSPYFGGYDFSQLVTAGVERIEIVRGPYSALWGADAVGGVVDVVPRRGGNGIGAEIALEGGGDGWARAEGTVSWGDGRTDVLVSGFHREADQGLPNSDFSTDQWLLDAGYSWGRGSRVALVVQDLSAEVEIPFTGASPTPNRHQSSDQTVFALPLTLGLSQRWSVELVASHVDRGFSFRDPDDPWGFTASDTDADTDSLRAVSHHHLGDSDLSWGLEWRSDTVDDRSVFGTNLDGRETNTSSLFVQDVWTASKAVTVIVGVRWDDADEWGSELSPRLAVGWRFARGWRLDAGYGEAFRQPSVGELYFPYSGNPDLDAERSSSWEVGLVRSCERYGIDWRLSLFDTSIDDMIQFDYAAYRFGNVGEADITGAELGFGKRFGKDLRLEAAVTWLDTEDGDGNDLLRRPGLSGSLTLAGRFLPRLRGDLTLRYVGARDDIDPVTFDRVRTGGFATADLAVAWRIAESLDLTLRVINLADRAYEEVLGYLAPGRRFVAGLRWGL